MNGITSLPDFMKIYQSTISTHDLYLMSATRLRWVCPTVNSLPSVAMVTSHPAFMSFLPYSKLRAMVAIVTVAKDFM
jgi:hypothetical protein